MRTSETDGVQRREFGEARSGRNAFDTALNHHDDVETVLSLAQELIGRAKTSRGGCEHHIRGLPGEDFLTVASEMITRAEREVLCILSTDGTTIDCRVHTLQLLQHARRRGVYVRALLPHSATESLAAMARATKDHAGYRAGEVPDQNFVIADEREAALRTPGHEESTRTLIVTARPIVQFLKTMLDTNWSSGIPVTEVLRVNEKLHGQLAQSILASLRTGEKDEVAARKLGMSVRTYRRHVAEIMLDVSATSRFQAGVRAVELGLISKHARSI